MSLMALVAWLWMAAQTQQIICNGPCGDPCYKYDGHGNWSYICGSLLAKRCEEGLVPFHSGGGDICVHQWAIDLGLKNRPAPAPAQEHVIEIKTLYQDRKDAIGVDRPSEIPCNVNTGPYLNCITAPVTHWHCADADHVLAGGFDELLFIDPQHPNKPYCIRVVRELWIDGAKWGVLRESEDK